MKLNKNSFIWIIIVVFFIGALLVVTVGSKDSEENQLERRLKAFTDILTPEMKKAFDEERYDDVKTLLKTKVAEYKSFLSKLPEDKKIFWLKAEFDKVPENVVNECPKELRDFYKGYFKVRDFECIHAFTEEETVDFFKIYFVQRLAEMKKKRK